MLKLTTCPEHSLQTLQQYLCFNTTCKRFEPGHNLFTFLVVHSTPLKYNCSYHRNHINLKFFFHLHLKPRSRAAKTHLIQNLIYWKKLTLLRMLVAISRTLHFWLIIQLVVIIKSAHKILSLTHRKCWGKPLFYRRINMAGLNCIGIKSSHIPFAFTTGNLIGF